MSSSSQDATWCTLGARRSHRKVCFAARSVLFYDFTWYLVLSSIILHVYDSSDDELDIEKEENI
jgi:hypothetical protein